MLNAAALIADLGYPLVVLTFDAAAAATCEEYGLPHMPSEQQLEATDFRQDRWGVEKVRGRSAKPEAFDLRAGASSC